ncbi:MAG: hypothetical protein LBM75_02900 [Myxococcales bacterium]|jgi:hypothetical protein|nr:hypothetical protein [Myxococcales bacterium]
MSDLLQVIAGVRKNSFSTHRHFEEPGDEATHRRSNSASPLDCFASLAMMERYFLGSSVIEDASLDEDRATRRTGDARLWREAGELQTEVKSEATEAGVSRTSFGDGIIDG